MVRALAGELIDRYDRAPTEQYARDSTPRELWNSPGFKRINQQLTVFWGVVFSLTAVSGVLATKGSHSTRDFFTWILPIILIVGAFKLQRRYVEYSQARAGGNATADQVT